MEFEELQSAWQSQAPVALPAINFELLLQEVRRNQRQLESTLFLRDAIEISIGLMLTVFFLWVAISKGHWSFAICASGCLFVSIFLMVDRTLQRRWRFTADAPLKNSIDASLKQVQHQIWLLRNIFWWYILPVAIGLSAVICSFTWQQRAAGRLPGIGLALYGLFCLLTCWGVYWLNQRAVRLNFDPRRKELETLLTTLQE
jgi:hypothetical protein